jgi:hypothetical protein
MEQTEHSEQLAFKLRTPANHPEESIEHSEHGESLKLRMHIFYSFKYCPLCIVRYAQWTIVEWISCGVVLLHRELIFLRMSRSVAFSSWQNALCPINITFTVESLLSQNLNINVYITIILPVLCGCDNWSLTLREGCGLRVLENRVLKGRGTR